jgi:predicted Fe-S protein YdhL (DUF1289 family)
LHVSEIPALVPSPCIGVCRIDPHSGLCLGCARTEDEITGWGTASEAARDQVWAALPDRRERLGIDVHRLPWTRDDIVRFIVRTLAPGGGTWVSGVQGGLAEFLVGTGEDIVVDVEPQTVTARTRSGAIRLGLSSGLRALEPGRAKSNGIVVLALPRDAVAAAAPLGLVSLGPDVDAISDSNRHETLYDLGLGLAAGQFCIRTGRPDLMEALDAQLGQTWPSLLATLGGQLVQASPTRVICSPIGRIEVFSAIPPQGGRSPEGSHTHLLPAQLARGGDLSVGLTIPDCYLLCAVHYPARCAGRPEIVSGENGQDREQVEPHT